MGESVERAAQDPISQNGGATRVNGHIVLATSGYVPTAQPGTRVGVGLAARLGMTRPDPPRRSPFTTSHNKFRRSEERSQMPPLGASPVARASSHARGDSQKPGADLTAQRLYPKIFEELIGPAPQALGSTAGRHSRQADRSSQ